MPHYMPTSAPPVPAKTRIVLLGDEHQVDSLRQTLASSGHACHCFFRPRDVLQHLRRDGCDLLILDWQIAGASAAEILTWVRESLAPSPPMLIVTAVSCEDDILAGIEAGADDYIVKPVRRNELVTRVNALLRLAYPAQHMSESIRFGPYVFETRARRLFLDGKPLVLRQKEFDLALLLFRNEGRPLSRAYMHEAVWGSDDDVPSRTLDTHVSRVRNKLGLRPENGFRLAPVYSYGYLLERVAASGGV